MRKVDLPDFDKMRQENDRLSPDQVRPMLKDRGIIPQRMLDERELFNTSTNREIEPFVSPRANWKSSLFTDNLRSPLIGSMNSADTQRELGAIQSGGMFLQSKRQFHAAGSKIHYLDFRHRFRTNHLRLHLLLIRRQKMKKHKLRKFRKKFKCLLAKQRLKREIAKEKTFRVELLSMIRDAEKFDPKEYALKIINEINSKPRELTKEEKLEELKELIRKNRYQVDYIKPKHRRADI